MESADSLTCYLVERDESGKVEASFSKCPRAQLPTGEVLIQVHWSSLNYKDALAASGHPGVVRSFPHVPGVDAAGVVLESDDPQWNAGDEVVVTGYELGAGHWGGWAELIRVPSTWVVARPEGLTLRECMAYGTAGLTAAACVEALEKHGIEPTKEGEVLVTGATGGVGSIALMLLAKLGYQAVALTGKPELAQVLQQWGATRVILDQVSSGISRPSSSRCWRHRNSDSPGTSTSVKPSAGGHVLRCLTSGSSSPKKSDVV